MIRSVVAVGGVSTETFYVSPFGFEGNALVMLLKVTNTGSSAVPVTAYAIHNFKLGSAPNPDAARRERRVDRVGRAPRRPRPAPAVAR